MSRRNVGLECHIPPTLGERFIRGSQESCGEIVLDENYYGGSSNKATPGSQRWKTARW